MKIYDYRTNELINGVTLKDLEDKYGEYLDIGDNNKKYYLLEDPYIDFECEQGTCMFAEAIDEDEELYILRWEIEPYDCGDEDCDHDEDCEDTGCCDDRDLCDMVENWNEFEVSLTTFSKLKDLS